MSTQRNRILGPPRFAALAGAVMFITSWSDGAHAQNPVQAPPPQQLNLGDPPPSFTTFPDELVEIRILGGHGTAVAENFRNGLHYDIGGQEIEFVRNERASANDPWETIGGIATTAYLIYAVAAREGGDELYVAGFLPGRDVIIEKWTVPPRNGGWYMSCATCPASAIGTAMVPFSTNVQIQGGSYISPGPRDTIVPVRTAIYQGPNLGHIRNMEVDPEGRFLLIHSHGSGSLLRFDLSQSPPPLELLFNTTTLPHLAQARTLDVYDYPTQGRKYLLTEAVHATIPGSASHTILNDDDNDGVIESFLTLDSTAWQASEYASDDNWKYLMNHDVVFDD